MPDEAEYVTLDYGFFSENWDEAEKILKENPKILYAVVFANPKHIELGLRSEYEYFILTRGKYFGYRREKGNWKTSENLLSLMLALHITLFRDATAEKIPWFFIETKDLDPNTLSKLLDEHVQKWKSAPEQV